MVPKLGNLTQDNCITHDIGKYADNDLMVWSVTFDTLECCYAWIDKLPSAAISVLIDLNNWFDDCYTPFSGLEFTLKASNTESKCIKMNALISFTQFITRSLFRWSVSNTNWTLIGICLLETVTDAKHHSIQQHRCFRMAC